MDRIRYVPAANEATVRSIRRGVLFLMAYWSGYAVQAFTGLTKVLARPDADGLELVVIDVDDSPELDALPELKGRLHHGSGEAVWVRDGRIVATSGPASFEANTVALLSC
jgi:hypothetical protein